jgi:hypothetical protein
MPINILRPEGTGSTVSKLTYLRLYQVEMTRDTFSDLLRLCPFLEKLNIRSTTLRLGKEKSSEFFHHTRIRTLKSPIAQVFEPDSTLSDEVTQPSLFRHFPKLEHWHTWSGSPRNEIPMSTVRQEMAQYCPLLTKFESEAEASKSTQLMVRAFPNGLTNITVVYSALSFNMVMAMITHLETLKHVRNYSDESRFYDSDSPPELMDQIKDYGWGILMLPRLCPELRTISFPVHEVEVSEIEKARWVCNDLERLHIRIKGLESKETIDRTVQLWRDGRNEKKEIPGDTIEERVARHLLQFEKLQEVWLGTGIRKVQI